MQSYARPTLFCSRCLGFAPCRWNGVTVRSEAIAALTPHVDFVTACPEMEIGLGVPRKPVRIVRLNDEPRLLQPDTGGDFTAAMVERVREIMTGLPAVEGFILKTRSPSCGPYDVKMYDGPARGATVARTAGFLGGAIVETFGKLAVEDEGRLTNFVLRERFLIKIFALADFRRARRTGRIAALQDFHARNKLMLMACHQSEQKALGRILGHRDKRPFDEVAADYEQHLIQAFRYGPKPSQVINVLMHALGYFKKSLQAKEKALFLDLLEEYRIGRAPLSAPTAVLRAWIARVEEPYLAQQTFFAPYPPELVTISDSGQGRDY